MLGVQTCTTVITVINRRRQVPPPPPRCYRTGRPACLVRSSAVLLLVLVVPLVEVDVKHDQTTGRQSSHQISTTAVRNTHYRLVSVGNDWLRDGKGISRSQTSSPPRFFFGHFWRTQPNPDLSLKNRPIKQKSNVIGVVVLVVMLVVVVVVVVGGGVVVIVLGLFVCLGFNGTFSTNRLYRAITVG